MEEQDIIYRGYKILIRKENFPENPRYLFDEATVFYSEISQIKNESDYDLTEFESWNKKKASIMFEKRILAIVPIYLDVNYYENNLNTKGVGVQIGFVYVEKETFHEFYGNDEWYKKYHKDKPYSEFCKELIEDHVVHLKNFLNDEVYFYYVIDPDGNNLSEVHHWYDHDLIIPDAQSTIDHHIKTKVKYRLRKLKGYINGKIPLIYRFPNHPVKFY